MSIESISIVTADNPALFPITLSLMVVAYLSRNHSLSRIVYLSTFPVFLFCNQVKLCALLASCRFIILIISNRLPVKLILNK